MKRFILSSLLVFLLTATALAEWPKYEPIYLWPAGEVPSAKGADEKDKPSIAVYPAAKEKANGTAVIIAPGGGYNIHAIDHEGVQVAKVLNKQGITAFVLKYRLKPYTTSDSLADANRAVRFVRSKAKEFNISPSRIGMLGFSAGGHLASASGTSFDGGDEKATDAIERVSSRPDFLVLCYPAISDKLLKGYPATDAKVTDKTPPSFIWFTSEDGLNPEHGILFYQALRKAKVEAEIHIYSRGVHGLGVAPGDPLVGQWPGQLNVWMRNSGLLTDAKRVAFTGKVTIDGKPINRGWITFIPVSPNAPISNFYLDRRDGSFSIPATHGPTPGKHRVIIHEVAKQLTTVPTIEDAVRFTTLKPGGEEMVVEVKEGMGAMVFEVVTK